MNMVEKNSQIPQYLRIKQEVERMIARGEFGRGGIVPGERALAQRLGANVGTVRRAMRVLAQEGKLVRVPRIGTAVSSPTAAGNGKGFWAVIVPTMEYFYPPVVHTIEEEARSRGVSIILNCTADDVALEQRLVQQAVENGAKGILIAPAAPMDPVRSPQSLEYLSELSVPAVMIDYWASEGPALGIDCVVSDDFAGAYEATTHMIRHGYRKIAVFGHRLREGQSPHPKGVLRMRGYQAAMADHSLTLPDLPDLYSWDIDWNPKAVRRYVEWGVEAFVFHEDSSASLLIKLLGKWGLKVPDDVAIIGYDNETFCNHTDPTITSVDVGKDEMARRAVKLLEDRIQSGTRGQYRSVMLRPSVVARESCGRNCPQRDTAAKPVPGHVTA